MTYDNIFYENEDKYEIENQNIFKCFINSFLNKVDLNFDEVKLLYSGSNEDYITFFNYLSDYIYEYYPCYIEKFYELLKSFGYNMNYEIQNAMFNLRNGITKETRNYVLKSPYINDIESKAGEIIIYSDKLGTHSFLPVKKYFKDSFDVKKFLKRNRRHLTGECHQRSWELLDILSNVNLVTSLLPYYFMGTIYHSVLRSDDNMIIDVANEIVYKNKVMDEVFGGKIVCETKKIDLESHLYEAIMASDDTNIEEEYSEPLILALHKQSLE